MLARVKQTLAMVKRFCELFKKISGTVKARKGLFLVTQAALQIGRGVFPKASGMVSSVDVLPESHR